MDAGREAPPFLSSVGMGRLRRREQRKLYALITGGGTGGHIIPVLTLARGLTEAGVPTECIELVGSRNGLDGNLLATVEFQVHLLPGKGISRDIGKLKENAIALSGLGIAYLRSLFLLLTRRPSVVISVGGYASLPCALAAATLRVPITLVNVDVLPGLANRLIARLAHLSATGYRGSDLPRAVVTGVPVRPEVAGVRRDPQSRRSARVELGLPHDRPVLVAFGGSLGSKRINEVVADFVTMPFSDGLPTLSVYHVVGKRDWPLMVSFFSTSETTSDRSLGSTVETVTEPSSGRSHRVVVLDEGRVFYKAVEYEDRMALLYQAADLMLCRAGGMTVAELATAGVPAVLVPLPGAPSDHQAANASVLADIGAAVVVSDAELTPERLGKEVASLMADPRHLVEMGELALSVGHSEATKTIVALLQSRFPWEEDDVLH